MQKVSVLLPTNNDDTYYYFVSKDMHVSLGTFVKVPFRNKIMLGVVWYDGDDKVDPKKIKEVIEILPIVGLNKNLVDFLNFFHRYNIVAIGKILRLVLPQDYLLQLPKRSVKRFQTVNNIKSKDTHLDLTSDQKKSASSIIKSIKEGKFSTVKNVKENISVQKEIEKLEKKEQALIDQIQKKEKYRSSGGVLRKGTLEKLRTDLEKISSSLAKKRSDLEKVEKLAKNNIFENVTYKGENAENPFTIYADRAEVEENTNIVHMKTMLITIFLMDSKWEIECAAGTYNKFNYNVFCFSDKSSGKYAVRGTDGNTVIYSQNLDLLDDEAVKIYNNVQIIDADKSSLYADRVDYDFESKLYHVDMFNKDESVKLKLIK